MKHLKAEKSISLKVISILLGAAEIYVFRFQNDGRVSFFQGLIVFVLSSFFIWLFGALLFQLFSAEKDFKKNSFFSKNRSLLFYSLWLLAFWSVHVIAYYPGGLCPDSVWQIQQGLVQDYITKHHPVFDSLLMASFIKIGRMLGSANVGLALFIVFQCIYAAFVLGYTLKTMQDYHAGKWMILTSFLIYACMPEYTGFVNTAIKDTLFSISFVLMETVLIRVHYEGSRYMYSFKHVMLWLAGACGTLLLRNNGIYAFLVTMIIGLLLSMHNGKVLLKKAVFFLIPILIMIGTNRLIDYRYHPVEDDTYASTLCIPLQQTARYVRDHGNEVTSKEKEAIDAVVEYDRLAEVYDPSIVDPIKRIFRSSNADEAKVRNYLKAWMQMNLKHPDTAMDALAEQDYYLFDLSRPYNDYYDGMAELAYSKTDPMDFLSQTGIILDEKTAERQHFWRVNVYDRIDSIPVLNLFDNIAFWNVLLFLVLSFMIFTGHKRDILYLIPLLVSFLICLAAPAVRNQQRYAFPIVYSLPIVIAVFFTKLKSRESEKQS